jgi:hypothetical protein
LKGKINNENCYFLSHNGKRGVIAMEVNMTNRSEVLFSCYQAKDSKIKNYIRKLKHKKMIRQSLKVIGIEYASIVPQEGIYKGKPEPSFILKLYDVPLSTVLSLAEELKKVFNQDNVIVEITKMAKNELILVQ